MSRHTLLLAAIAVGALLLFQSSHTPQTAPPPPVKPSPSPQPDDDDAPPRRPCPGPRPWPHVLTAPGREPQKGGLVSPDGTVRVKIPVFDLVLKHNISSRGLGCCGSRSLEYAARNVGEERLYDLPEQMRRAGIPGGDNPYTIASKMARFAPDARYFQDTNSTLEVLEACLKTYRIACVGYGGHDPHYSGHVDHCVCVIACDLAKNWVCVLDNNFPVESELVWMGAQEFESRWNECLSRWIYSLLAVRPGDLPQQGSVHRSSGSDSGEWRPFADDGNEYSLWRDDVQLGNWRVDRRLYYPLRPTGDFDAGTDPPCAPPQWPDYPANRTDAGFLNYGLTATGNKLLTGSQIDGKKVTRSELLALIGPELAPVAPPGDPFGSLIAMARPHATILICIGAVVALMILSRPIKESEE
jgi:hypothetical protein